MRKIDWCVLSAPTALARSSDGELLRYMSSAADRSGIVFDAEDYLGDLRNASVEEQLDFIFRRIANSFGDEVAFKGGYVLRSIVGNDARTTLDIDVDALNESISNSLVDELETLGKELKFAGVITSFRSRGIPVEDRCGGYDYRRLDGVVIRVDIGATSTSNMLVQRNIKGIVVQGYSIDNHLADKLTAILGDKVLRRTKDFI